MKKALRVILPTLMILVILASAVWYLLIFDPGFTRDSIMNTGRTFDTLGHHKIAAWLYDLAYHQTQGDGNIAIELANHYKAHGNYTKAESTLSGAIADNGSIDLYLALCDTYVEQDKLLDAVNMLSNIKNEEIKDQLQAMRPSAPTLTPGGDYTRYINIQAEAEESCDIYLNTNGECPSTAKDHYTGEIALSGGETTVFAVAVNKQNLVSEIIIQKYTIGGVIEDIEFTDEVLEAYIREQLNFNATRPFKSNDLWDIKELTIPEGVQSFEDLRFFTYLEKLTISGCSNADLSAIAANKELTELTITEASLSQDSLEAIGSLKNLNRLVLSDCGLSSVSDLSGLKELTYLDLSGNTLRNISIFENFTKLQELYMKDNALTELDALSKMQNLTTLDVTHNSLLSIAPIYTLPNLKTLLVGNNAVSDISGIGVMTGLQILDLSQNALIDLAPLETCTSLTELTLNNNLITDISVTGKLTKLVRLDVAHNKIAALPDFPADHVLGYLDISYNLLKDIKALSVLEEIYSVNIDYNENIDSLDPLLDAHHLILVNCYGTKIVRSPFPEGYGVVVNLDPSLFYGAE